MPELSERLSFTLGRELDVKGMDVPLEVQVLPAGEVSPRGKTKFIVDGEARELILAAFGGSSTDLVIDYEHQSLSGAEAPAAGWIKGLEDKGEDGIWAKVQWTERAREYLRGREYRYLSPVVLIRKKDGRAVELLGAALTNLPAIDGMAPLANRADPVPGPESRPEPGPYKEMYLGVLKIFGLPEDAGMAEVQAKVSALTDPEGFVPEAEHQALKDTLKRVETEAMVSGALASGKITPPLLPWARAYAASDPEGFREFIGKACPVVHLDETAGINTPGSVDRVQREVNKLLRIGDDTFIRYGRAASI